MDADSQEFFEELTSCSRSSFKPRFDRTVRQLRLNPALRQEELSRLREAALLSALCNISFNGLGGCAGEIKPEKEPTRRRLEHAFMDACNNFFRSAGWKKLPARQKQSVRNVFLTVVVDEENLAG
jgi:hypothetical protein